ncbi:hypothetical protein OE749_09510 [Aestuariibacter sp. AA17]|uniref:Uncharacterized protein n=1 Tax=Fluctibacter corallii TaxID=2984329 RepID=A0ABT3A9I3_9ALTE|nr:hypothetical protein [Aestuariibacter sp. AA17]MCV2884932.1 hypothetical protein [Aestuariibacter sp. AA17]
MEIKRSLIISTLVLVGIYYLISYDNTETTDITPHEGTSPNSTSLLESKGEAVYATPNTADTAKHDTSLFMSHNNDVNVKASPTSHKKMHYDDEWCVAAEDLSEQDFYRAQQERGEWLLERGVAFIDLDLGEEVRIFDKPGLNHEHVRPYEEASLDELKRLANRNDKLALTTLIQRKDFSISERVAAAEQLLILGDTSFGLQYLTQNALNKADVEFQDQGRITETVKRHLIGALGYVEYGLQRLDTHALETYLRYVDEDTGYLGDLAPEYVLNDEELAKVANASSNIRNFINKYRAQIKLSPIENEDYPRIAYANFNERLALIYGLNAKTLRQNSRVVSLWSDTYLKKTPCIERITLIYKGIKRG